MAQWFLRKTSLNFEMTDVTLAIQGQEMTLVSNTHVSYLPTKLTASTNFELTGSKSLKKKKKKSTLFTFSHRKA